MSFFKYNVRSVPGFYVWAYRPYRTKKGKYVWRAASVVDGPYKTWKEAEEAHPEAVHAMLHNVPLSDLETLSAIGHEEPPG